MSDKFFGLIWSGFSRWLCGIFVLKWGDFGIFFCIRGSMSKQHGYGYDVDLKHWYDKSNIATPKKIVHGTQHHI